MIGRFLSWLVGTFCAHRWTNVEQVEVYEHSRSTRPTYTDYILQCTKCGAMSKARL